MESRDQKNTINEIKRLINEYQIALGIEIKNWIIANTDENNKHLIRNLELNNISGYVTLAEHRRYTDLMLRAPAIQSALAKYKELERIKGYVIVPDQKESSENQLADQFSSKSVDILTKRRGYFKSTKGENLVSHITATLPLDKQLLLLVDEYMRALAQEIKTAVLANRSKTQSWSVYNGTDALAIANKFIERLPDQQDTSIEELRTPDSFSKKTIGAAKKYEALIKLKTALEAGSELSIDDRIDIESKLTAKRGLFSSKSGNKVATNMNTALVEAQRRRAQKRG